MRLTPPLLWTCVMAFMLNAAPLHAAQQPPPRFQWTAFQFFWNKTATPLVKLDNARRVADGYIIDYGYTTTLTVLLKDDTVSGVSIRFVGGGDNDAGGPQFLRLIHQTITSGSFRWPPEKVQEARDYFAVISPAPKEFQYGASRFQRSFTLGQGWEFRFEFVRED